MATNFKNVLKSNIGTSQQTVLTTESTAKTTLIGLSLTNMTSNLAFASIQIVNTDTLDAAYYIREVAIPPNQSLRVINGGEKLILAPNTNVKINSSVANSLDLVMSYVEIV